MYLVLTSDDAASSVFLPSISTGPPAEQMASKPMDGDGYAWGQYFSLLLILSSLEFLLLLLMLSLVRSFAWCFTIISSNVFRGWLWACNDKSQKKNIVFISVYQRRVKLPLLPCSFCTGPLCEEWPVNVICYWCWCQSSDAPHPYRQSSSSDPAQQCDSVCT